MMTRRTPGPCCRAAAVLLVLLAFAPMPRAQTTGATARHFLWAVKSATHTLYLAGSLHALTPEVYPLDDVFEQASAASDTLVEEVDMATLEGNGTNPALLVRGLLPPGRTLQSTVSPATWVTVTNYTARLGMPAEVLQPFEPWMAVMMISAFELQQAGLSTALGLDKHFFDRAVQTKRTVVGLETADSQIARLDDLPAAAQEQLLRATLGEMETSRRQLATLVSAWRTGDHTAIEKATLGDLRAHPDVYRSLIVERNLNWMPRLDTCLSAHACFVVVGAAHLVGPDGLLALLARKGYSIAQQ